VTRKKFYNADIGQHTFGWLEATQTKKNISQLTVKKHTRERLKQEMNNKEMKVINSLIRVRGLYYKNVYDRKYLRTTIS
jgi:arsenate reductase-like glutaredoxin family protein